MKRNEKDGARLPLKDRIEAHPSLQAVRKGLVLCIPILLIGAMALVLRNLPIEPYLAFITTFAGGAIATVLDIANNATFGLLSVFVSFTVSLCYAQQKETGFEYTPPMAALVCFAIFAGFGSADFTITAFGVRGMFTAVLSSILSTKFFIWLRSKDSLRVSLYSDGSDATFNNAVSSIIPFVLTVTGAALINLAITRLFGVTGLHELFIRTVGLVFSGMGRSFFSGLLFVMISSVLWFFGIHGSDVLETTMLDIFAPGVGINAALAAQGQAPTEIFTRQFFEIFVLMGGCGALLCLLISIFLFAKRKNTRELARMAALPMLFNINEMMVFGLPVALNSTLFVPFVLTPIACLVTSYLAMKTGLVPLVTSEVGWTTPAVWGGYVATGSWRGSALQVFNIAMGVMIYRPFILRYERSKEENLKAKLKALYSILAKSEEDGVPVTLTERRDGAGELARSLVSDIRVAVDEGAFEVYYQPQHDEDGECVSAEALLRFTHPKLGAIAPPLVVKLAEEGGTLIELEHAIFTRVARDMARIREKKILHISVNVTAATLSDDGFDELLAELKETYALREGEMMIEITEQMTLLLDDVMEEKLKKICDMGFTFAIDDFSMGHTSLNYLKTKHFSEIKLDGTLVRGLKENARCADIISSIVYLSSSLGYNVLAEFVENEEERKSLEALGVMRYQGYLFSPALRLGEFLEYICPKDIDPKSACAKAPEAGSPPRGSVG